MKKPSHAPTRALLDLVIAILVFLALVAVFWIYLLFDMLNAAWVFILAHRGMRNEDDLSH